MVRENIKQEAMLIYLPPLQQCQKQLPAAATVPHWSLPMLGKF